MVHNTYFLVIPATVRVVLRDRSVYLDPMEDVESTGLQEQTTTLHDHYLNIPIQYETIIP